MTVLIFAEWQDFLAHARLSVCQGDWCVSAPHVRPVMAQQHPVENADQEGPVFRDTIGKSVKSLGEKETVPDTTLLPWIPSQAPLRVFPPSFDENISRHHSRHFSSHLKIVAFSNCSRCFLFNFS